MRGLLAGPSHPVWAYRDGGIAPELVLAETANALTLYVRAGRMTPSQAGRALSYVLGLRLGLEPIHALVAPALEVALRHGISAYDACYLALADQTGAVLVTADRRLASLAGRAELVA